MSNHDVVAVLNKLIDTCKDGELSYKTCADDAGERNSPLQIQFAHLQGEHAAAVAELQGLIAHLGGRERAPGSISEAIRLSWVNLKIAIAGKDDRAVLAECQRSEETATRRYAEALEQALPEDVRRVLERQCHDVMANRDQIQLLHHQLDIEA